MNQNVFILKTTADFAPGAFENTAVEDGSIRLGRSVGAFLPSGCYTSPFFRCVPFTRAIASWNADTPPGTAVEAQARLCVNGKWSHWLSFGKWSPFIERASSNEGGDEIACIKAEDLTVAEGMPPADMAQIRIFLYSDDATTSPQVHLLSLATEPFRDESLEFSPTPSRTLICPCYSCLTRDPVIAGRIASVTTLTMMMNRWGKDVLPEEVARCIYDNTASRFNNLSFLAACAGSYGFESLIVFWDLQKLYSEVRHGNNIGAFIHYAAPVLEEQQDEENTSSTEQNSGLPVLPDATNSSQGHFVVVRGFTTINDDACVIINDPFAPTDADVEKTIPLSLFENLYVGICLVLHPGPQNAGNARPTRKLIDVTLGDGYLSFAARGETSLPSTEELRDTAHTTICYTLSDETAYASAAQKKFYYPTLEDDGVLLMDTRHFAGRLATVYFIGSHGISLVGEKKLPPSLKE